MPEIALMADDVSDDELFAYLDNAVPEAERARLETRIAEDSALRARLERLRRANQVLEAAFPMPRSTPDALIHLVDRGFAARAAPRRESPTVQWRRLAAAAAGFALIGAGGYWVGSINQSPSLMSVTRVEPGNRLYAALNATPSGQTAALAGGDSVKPILSFQAANGEYCREVEFNRGATASVGILCRDDGAWRTIVLIESEGGPDSNGGYATVGDVAVMELEEAYARLNGGDPLSPEAEQAAIVSNWNADD